jgi:DNA-binding HxlR family transcriptional regulator
MPKEGVIVKIESQLVYSIGKRWSIAILRRLREKRYARNPAKGLLFGELMGVVGEGLSSKVLSVRLREFVDLGLITRKVISEADRPIRVRYTITEKGENVLYHIEKLIGLEVEN